MMGSNPYFNRIHTEEGSSVCTLIITSKKHGEIKSTFSLIDLDIVSKYNWGVAKHGEYMYVRSSNSNIILHRYLTDPAIGFVVDHKNGNTLDNTRENLRVCTISENNRNLTKKKEIPKCIYRRKDTLKESWRVKIGHNGEDIRIGTFSTYLEALKAYNKFAKELHGDFAILYPEPNA